MTAPVALVTGGSSGIGERTVLELLDAGFVVYAVARRTDRMQASTDERCSFAKAPPHSARGSGSMPRSR